MGWESLVGPIGGLLGNLAGGIFGSSNADAANRMQLEIAEKNIAMQREFAQNGIRWKVGDALAAGIHPVAAMGAQTASFSPISVNPSVPDTSWASGLGQNIGRAVQAGLTWNERKEQQQMDNVAQTLRLNNMGLQNELLGAQIERIRSGPPMPTLGQSSPGGGNSGDVVNNPAMGTFEMKPNEVTTSIPGQRAHTAGPAGPQNNWAIGPNGALQPFPPKGLGVEDEFGAPLMARWLATQSYYKPPDATWKNVWPDAVDVKWSTTSLGWVPVYSVSNNQDPNWLRERGLLRSSGARPGFGDPLYPSRGRSGRELPAPYISR